MAGALLLLHMFHSCQKVHDLRSPVRETCLASSLDEQVMLFKKRPKTMSERPNEAPEATAADKATVQQDSPDAATVTDAGDAPTGEQQVVSEASAQLDAALSEAAELKDRWLRLNAEFDNFRKRTAKEKLEMLQFAGENSLKNMLPVVDDMERAIANNANTSDIAVVREGFHLIHSKLLHILGSQGVKVMENVKGQPFDVDKHEAITKAPAPSDELKGKVIDVVESGYTLHDKVIRYAKVVVGE
jgi:molecular chaperone GrpE